MLAALVPLPGCETLTIQVSGLAEERNGHSLTD
jgi:hypothetical protein